MPGYCFPARIDKFEGGFSISRGWCGIQVDTNGPEPETVRSGKKGDELPDFNIYKRLYEYQGREG